MNHLDLDQLHDQFGNKHGRQTGRTTDMLVNAIQHADFGVPGIVIIAAHRGHVQDLIIRFHQIVGTLGHSVENHLHPNNWTEGHLTIRSTAFYFRTPREDERLRIGQHEKPTFWDHSAATKPA